MSPLTACDQLSGAAPDRASGLDRRTALKLLASGAALGLAACAKPSEEIVPYVDMPERLVPGEPLRFATSLPLAGYGRGMLVTSIDGRPIKVEGNPHHPASLGATDVFAQGAVFSLFDPDRSRAVRGPDGVSSWDAFGAALRGQMQKEEDRRGAGLRLLTGRVTSPTLLRQIADLLERYPQARWYRYEPVDDDEIRAGAMLAFGRALTPRARLRDASVVLALDADPLGPGPEQSRLANEFASRRRSAHGEEFLRLYAVEPAISLTGANADHRLALAPQLIETVALTVASSLGADVRAGELPESAARFAQVAAADLEARRGRAVVLVGAAQPARVHALAHWINAQIAAPVDFIEPVDPATEPHRAALSAFADDCASGRAKTALIVGCNPAYDSPGRSDIAEALRGVGLSVHCGPYEDETAALCRWHLPQSDPLESWSDLRAPDGTAGIVQPLIRPLYDTRTTHDLLAMLGGALSPSSYDIVRETWRGAAAGDFEDWWRQTLHDGAISGSAHRVVSPGAPKLPEIPSNAAPNAGFVLSTVPDPGLWDGSFANNAWLQECPKPLTKQVWGNALHLSPADAKRFDLHDSDIVRLSRGTISTEAPVLVDIYQAAGAGTAALGHGRRSGAIASGVGSNVFPLRPISGGRWTDVSVSRTGRQQSILTTQHRFRLEGDARDLLRTATLAELERAKDALWPQPALPTLYPKVAYDTYAWAMVIDNSACIGCNACVVACQAENNVPVVGPDEIAAGRDMHWLRVDTYRHEDARAPAGFQPVPCMHCEQAPCEPVCPVAASVHDGEGLNVQVYNRCVGTRFCQSNCPYKVRRFNFFGYADGQEFANLGEEPMRAQRNPDVTVRARGVMEKCTYCVQRVSRARRAAEKESRRIRDGEVATACQAACPTRAIAFGDLNNPGSNVNGLRREHRHYELLGHLGTRPRTTYLARLRNPNPALEEPQA